jgi:hypothetical protein
VYTVRHTDPLSFIPNSREFQKRKKVPFLVIGMRMCIDNSTVAQVASAAAAYAAVATRG